jgi:hypothetical protein
MDWSNRRRIDLHEGKPVQPISGRCRSELLRPVTMPQWLSFAQLEQEVAASTRDKFAASESTITLAAALEGMMPNTDKLHLRTKMKSWENSLPDAAPELKSANDHSVWPRDFRNAAILLRQ